MAGLAKRHSRAAIVRRALLAALACGPWLLASQGCRPATHGPARWQLAPDAAEDRIAVREEGGSALFEVQSPRGIGGATVRRVSDPRPRAIVLRFRLQGLEELRFEYDSTVVTASLPATGTVLEEVRTAGRPARRLEPGDPHWLAIQPLGADGRPGARPQPGGAIEVRAPEDFVRRGGREFRLRWIDFYR